MVRYYDDGGGGNYYPEDLNKDNQIKTAQDYFTVPVTGLKIDSTYAFQFQWAYEDGSVSEWSPGYIVNTPTENVPSAPSVTVPSTSVGSIPVTLSTFPANAKRVDIYVIGGEFGTGKVADYFLTAGTKSIAVSGGSYQVSLITVTPSGINGDPTNTFNITVSTAGESIQAPTNPNGFSSKRILAGIEVSWAGTYANSTFTGFEAINIYAGNSSSATPGTYEQVGVLTGNNVKNTIVVPLGTYVSYGQPVYIHAAAVNKNGTVGSIQSNVTNQPLGPGKATDADINDGAVVISKLASDVLTVGNLKAGDINATSYIRAGTAASARVELSSANISGGPSAGFYIYNSAGTPILSAPLSGGLSIIGDGTFSGDISGASGTFAGNLSASNGLFSVSNGILTAQSGTIGGWTINSTQLRSSGTNYISLNPVTPKIALIQSGVEKITIDPIEGIKDSLGNFTLTPSGTLTLKGAITSGSTITGADITMTGAASSSGSLAPTKLFFQASNYAISAGSSSFTYAGQSGYYDSEGEWVSTGANQTITNNDIRFTDATYAGSVPYSTNFYYGELWLGSGSGSAGSVDLWANHPDGYIGVSLVADSSQKNIYVYGDSSAGFGTYHTTASSQAPAMLQVDSTGRMTRGRAIMTGSSSNPSNTYGLTGDLYFSTAV